MKELLSSQGWTTKPGDGCNCIGGYIAYYRNPAFGRAQVRVQEKNSWFRIVKEDNRIVQDWAEQKDLEKHLKRLSLWNA